MTMFPKPKDKPSPRTSLRYDLICDGAVRKYPDGREVCEDTPKGRAEYKSRTMQMRTRQKAHCCLCWLPMTIKDTTFEHTNLRGAGGAFRDDRIVDGDRNPMNGAAHGFCNSRKGSKRC